MVALCGLPFDKTQGLKLGHLATDRGMAAADKAREIDDADRMRAPDPRQQGKQRAIELHTGLRQERLINVGPIHVAMQLQEDGVEFV